MPDSLEHLTPTQITELMGRYYEGENIHKLLADFEIHTKPSKLVSLFPPTVHPETCPYCPNVHLVSKQLGRSVGSYRQPVPACPQCGHVQTGICICQNCKTLRQLQREKEANRKRDTVTRFIQAHQVEIPPFEILTLQDSLYLLAAIRHSSSENFSDIQPLSGSLPLLAPTFTFQDEIVHHLLRRGLIGISPKSSLESFVFNEAEDQIQSYYPARITWDLLPGTPQSFKKEYIQNIDTCMENLDWKALWKTEAAEIALVICKYECIEYFLYLLEERDFHIENLGEKTHMIFENLLHNFSVAQIFNLTWQAVRDVSDYTRKEHIPSYRGKNIFIGSIQRKAEKALAENWTVKNSRRDFNCPQTIISALFFDRFMGVGERGFEDPLVSLGIYSAKDAEEPVGK